MDHQAVGGLCPVGTLIIIGASARALAESATAAGWAVHAADLFGDDDLRSAAVRTVRADPRGYPRSLAVAVNDLPPGAWCYTGAVENDPFLIDDLAAARPLAGNTGQVVRAIRDPARLGATVHAAGLLFPETHSTPTGLPRDGSFLAKPLLSAAGRRIRPWTPETPACDNATMIWQRRVPGIPHAASFIMRDGRARLFGLSRSLIGTPWCGGGPFAYGGSVTLPAGGIPSRFLDVATRCGELLAAHFGLVGAVGVDFIIDDNGHPWILEVNPRPTASMELHERAHGMSVAAAHLEACGFVLPHPVSATCPGDGRVWAKAVLHTPACLTITPALVADWHHHAARWSLADGGRSAIADIPTLSQTLAARAPVLTVFAAGESIDATLAELYGRAQMLSATWEQAVSPPSVAAPLPLPRARCTA